MNGSCEMPEERLCGCCEGIGRETPEPIYNRPALSQVGYRVGRHATFKASMLAELSDPRLPALAALRTRDDSDFSIALLDAYATVLDILTFYQERLANESYLRTAVDPSSVMGLAQLVGYKPSPGVAASAFLAFTLSSAPGSPDNVLIPAGTRVQSVPKPGQTPQVFETSNDLTALISSNAIPPQTTIPWGLNNGDTSIWLQGTSNNLNPGDALLFINQAFHQQVLSGTARNDAQADFHFVSSVEINTQAQQTKIVWDQPLVWSTPYDAAAYIYVMRKRAALFGAQAIDPRSLTVVTGSGLTNVTGWPNSDGTPETPASDDWDFTAAFTSPAIINLDASYPGLSPSQDSSAEPQWVVLVGAATAQPTPTSFRLESTVETLHNLSVPSAIFNVQLAAGTSPSVSSAVFSVQSTAEISPNAFLITTKTTQLVLASNNVPLTTTGLMIPNSYETDVSTFLNDAVVHTRNTTAYVQSEPLTPADSPLTDWIYDDTYTRQAGLLKPVEGSALGIVGGQQLSSGQVVAIFGKRLRLQVVSFATIPPGSQPAFVPGGATAGKQLSDGQLFLVDAFPPSPTGSVADSDELWSVLTVDGVAGTLQINPSNLLLTAADKNDPVVGESGVISQAPVSGTIMTLNLKQPLARIYDRSTVSVNANVVAATQGETMHEILGSGDATNPALNFTLKQAPLTYISSPTGMGASSTLEVWVNNLQWHEVDNFLESNPTDRVFVTKRDATGKTTVQFGDGVHGGRTPTGQMNLRAVYRKGLGALGNVQAGQLSQALDRPQGLKGVINPDPATGGADPDSGDAARVSAPLHALTLGRVVSLEDYQNYARAFPGIEKALATWTWFGRMRGVFLTIAGAGGIVFRSDDDTITNLVTSLHAVGNPFVPIQVASYVPVLFEIAATIRIDLNDYDPTQVLGQVWQSLSARFGFEQRGLGQGLAQSEIITVIQHTPGVIAVELTAFNKQGQTQADGTPLPPVLRAASPVPGQDDTVKGAEMLVLDPAAQGNLGVWS